MKRNVVFLVVMLLGIIVLTGCGKKQPDQTPSVPVQTDAKQGDEKKAEDNSNHPLLVGYSEYEGNQYCYVFGGSNKGKWLTFNDFNVKFNGKNVSLEEFVKSYDYIAMNYGQSEMIKGDEIYNFYSDEKKIISTKSKVQKLLISPASGDILLRVDLNPFSASENLVIGICGDWNAIPRIIKKNADGKSYIVDIDGDGTDDTIKIEDKVNQGDNVPPIEKSVYLIKGTNKILIDKFDLYEEHHSSLKMHTFDLNGDGKLEILADISHEYGESVIAYELNADKITKIFSYYIGD